VTEEKILDEFEIEEEVDGEEGTAVAETAEPLTLEEQLAAAQAEAARNLDGWQRTQAEFANARKRFEKQRTEANNNATADVIAKVLPVIDDFDRALGNVPEAITKDGWFEGIQLVHRKLNTILEHFNVVPIEAVGQTFDPALHEALMQEPSDEYESGTVTRELQKGYKVGERVIRPSLVYVAE
jgi:molecular chaperone GrpE